MHGDRDKWAIQRQKRRKVGRPCLWVDFFPLLPPVLFERHAVCSATANRNYLPCLSQSQKDAKKHRFSSHPVAGKRDNQVTVHDQ